MMCVKILTVSERGQVCKEQRDLQLKLFKEEKIICDLFSRKTIQNCWQACPFNSRRSNDSCVFLCEL